MTRSQRGLQMEAARLRRRVRELETEVARLRSVALANATIAADLVAAALTDGTAHISLHDLVTDDLQLDEQSLARALHVE